MRALPVQNCNDIRYDKQCANFLNPLRIGALKYVEQIKIKEQAQRNLKTVFVVSLFFAPEFIWNRFFEFYWADLEMRFGS